MRLVNVGLGEIADRLTILALKIATAAQEGKDAGHFVTERAALLVKFRATPLDSGPIVEAFLGLAATNALLWHAEDEMRAFRESPTGYKDREREVAAVAFRIQSLNDQRAAFVRTLNQLAGSDLGPEKL